jgi:hypothetical protein
MADTTNVPGAISITVRGIGHVTLRPEWAALLDTVCQELGIPRTEILRRAVAAYPEPNCAEATRLWVASHLIERAARVPTAKVVMFDGITRLNLPPDRLLDAAGGKLESVVIAGYDKDGSEYFASSIADGGEALWILQRASHRLLAMADT